MPSLSNLAGLDHELSRVDSLRPRPKKTIETVGGLSVKAKQLADRVKGILAKLEYWQREIDWYIYNPHLITDTEEIVVVARVHVLNVENNMPIVVQSTQFIVYPDMSEENIVLGLYHLIQHFEQHETAEHFVYNGGKPFDPHAKDHLGMASKSDGLKR